MAITRARFSPVIPRPQKILAQRPSRRPSSTAKSNDLHLVLSIQKRCDVQEHWERLVPHFTPMLRAFILSSLPFGADPEDLIQETWVRVFRCIDQFDPQRAQFRTWIFGIARNLMVDWLRSEHGRRQGRSIVSLYNPEGELRFHCKAQTFQGCDLGFTMLQEDLDSLMGLTWRGLQTLSEQNIQVALSRNLDPKNCSAVSRALGIPPHAVIYRTKVAVDHLTQFLLVQIKTGLPRLEHEERGQVERHREAFRYLLQKIFPRLLAEGINPLSRNYFSSTGV